MSGMGVLRGWDEGADGVAEAAAGVPGDAGGLLEGGEQADVVQAGTAEVDVLPGFLGHLQGVDDHGPGAVEFGPLAVVVVCGDAGQSDRGSVLDELEDLPGDHGWVSPAWRRTGLGLRTPRCRSSLASRSSVVNWTASP